MIPLILVAGIALLLLDRNASASPLANNPMAMQQLQQQQLQQQQQQQQVIQPQLSQSGVGPAIGNLGVGALSTGLKSGVAAGGTLIGGLGAGVTTLGIGAAVIGGAILATNLFQCGTVTQIGCEKRSDTTTQIMAEIIARKLAYGVESGAISKSDALSALSQTYQQYLSARKVPSTHGTATWYVGATPVAGYPDPLPQLADVPANSKSGSYFVGQPASDTQFFTQVMPAFINSL